MSRLRDVALPEMSADQRAFYDSYATGRRAEGTSALRLVDDSGRLLGPPALWIHHAPLAGVLERFGTVIRFELSVPPAAAEIAILLVAHHHACAFEIHAHTPAATAAGLTADQLDALSCRQRPTFSSEAERAAYDAASALLADGSLSDDDYAQLESALGAVGALELVTLVGYYTMLAFQLNSFRVHPPATGEDDSE